MSTKAAVKHVRALHQKKYRDAEGLFLVQGEKVVRELLASDWPVQAVYATEASAQALGLKDAVILPEHELERMGTFQSGNTVVAVVPRPPVAPLKPLGMEELVLALDGIADPGNLGTVLRIADWFGVQRVICDPGTVEVFNPKCIQASMGAFLRVQVVPVDLVAELDRLRSAGAQVYVASMEGGDVFDRSLQWPAVLVLGSESHGVSKAVRALAIEAISVPRFGAAESLNVAMAASALCMEFARQRRRP